MAIPPRILNNLDPSSYLILDVRTCHEYVGGHVAGALNIPYEDLDINLKMLQDLDKPIVICSSGGHRSKRAARYLKISGLQVLDGGDWENLAEKLELEQEG